MGDRVRPLQAEIRNEATVGALYDAAEGGAC